MEKPVITVGLRDADLNGNSNETIQMAIDRIAGLGGGTVVLLPGHYVIKDSLHLRSHVVLQGSGEATVLWKPPSLSSSVIGVNGYGLYTVSVADPDRFAIGTGVIVRDKLATAFYTTVATVSWKRGQELGLSRFLNHDIAQISEGMVSSVYPIISGIDVVQAGIENLVIDGNAANNDHIDGCRGGGINLLRSDRSQIRNVMVRNYNGDGISFQQCTDTLVEYCTCEDNRGSGLHPGSGSVGFVIRNSVSRNNGLDGLFYCLRVSYSLCENCLFEGNGRDGVSIGHQDTDAIIRGNRITGNKRYGLYTRPDSAGRSGDRTLIVNNDFISNGVGNSEYAIYLDAAFEDMFIGHNRFNSGLHRQLLRSAVFVNVSECQLNLFDNESNSVELIESADPSYLNGVLFEEPKESLAVEIGQIPAEAYRHLSASQSR